MAKRRRGRPPGSRNLKPRVDKGIRKATNIKEPIIEGKRRGRGRPPGAKNKPKFKVTVNGLIPWIFMGGMGGTIMSKKAEANSLKKCPINCPNTK